jgi:uncharacterized protein (TIGR04255 family)
MAAAPIADPLRGPPPREIPLKRAPLLRVIAQVRFPTLLAVRSADRVSGFQDAVRERYPYLEREDIAMLSVGPISVPDASHEAVVHWRFWDAQRQWRTTLNQDFLAIETTAYESRADFMANLGEVLRAFQTIFQPNSATRLGMRYIDQIKPPSVERITDLLIPEIVGTAKFFGKEAQHLITQLSVNASPGSLVARWGKLPKGMTVDPTVMQPTEEESWIIDLDLSETSETTFDPEALIARVRTYAERIYTVFRWMVTDEFLREYGGTCERTHEYADTELCSSA